MFPAQVAPAEVPGSLAPFIARDATNTRQTLQFASGAKWLLLQYVLLPGATAVANQFMKVVLNAASDADATGKLATDGCFIAIFQGQVPAFVPATPGDPITRLDFITEQAVGAEKTVFQVLGGI